MIVARGLGRGSAGRILVTAGLGLVAAATYPPILATAGGGGGSGGGGSVILRYEASNNMQIAMSICIAAGLELM